MDHGAEGEGRQNAGWRLRDVSTRVVVLTLVVLVLAGVIAGAWYATGCAQTALEAERTLDAYRLTVNLVATYVDAHHGEWPPNWDALSTVAPSRTTMWRWPEDIASVRSRVRVDFSAKCADAARATAKSFDAIEQVGPHYPPDDGDIRPLVGACQQVVREEAKTGAGSPRKDGRSEE